MCGRYTLTNRKLTRFEQALAVTLPELEARYNIAPGQANPVIHATDAGYQLGHCKWGLIPHWLKEPKTQYSTINAKVETVADKPFYRDAFRQRRCLVPADGWYEWRKTADRKQPYYIHQGGEMFAFAGLWDHWAGDGAGPFDSYTIITGPAAEAVADIHPRMPLVLPEAAWRAWLDPATPRSELADLLAAPETAFEAHPVSTRVNNPRNESPDLAQPQGAPGGE